MDKESEGHVVHEANTVVDSEGDGKERLRSSTRKPVHSMRDVLTRFNESRSWRCNGTAPRNSDTFKRLADEHLVGYDIRLQDDGEEAAKPTTIIVKTCATFENVSFFLDPSDGSFHSVKDSAMRAAMLQRGFGEVKPTHHTAMITLPRTNPYGSVMGSVPTAPRALSLPARGLLQGKQKIPALWRSSPDETAASAIARAFEEKVVDNSRPQDVYSPYKLWTKQARADHGIVDSNFTNYCKIYYTVRKLRNGKSVGDIHDKMKALRVEAKQSMDAICTDPDWFQIAKDIADSQ